MLLMLGDCLERMAEIDAGSVDLVLADVPYGTTACKWDSVIPFPPMWEHLRRVSKVGAANVLFASQPFTSALVMSNIENFRYDWMQDKVTTGGFSYAKYRPMAAHESILIFGRGTILYNPQMIKRTPEELKRLPKKGGETARSEHHATMTGRYYSRKDRPYKYPSTVIRIKGLSNRAKERVGHPTQKPIELMEYLIKTYSGEGDNVLDFCMGSGTTGVACIRTGRKFIGIELRPDYYKNAEERIKTEAQRLGQTVLWDL